MTPVDYTKLSQYERRLVREEYVAEQDGRCYYCQALLDGPPATSVAEKRVTRSRFPKGFFSHLIHLHHDHKTGLTLGAVHAHCNAVAWEYDGE